jgi:hypothetical protein
MVFIIFIALIIALVVGYFVIKKTTRQSGEPVNNHPDLKPIAPTDPDTRPRRPKY